MVLRPLIAQELARARTERLRADGRGGATARETRSSTPGLTGGGGPARERRASAHRHRVGKMSMDVLGLILVPAVAAALWIAAVVCGRDSRDGRDWLARSDLRKRPSRTGD